MKPYQQVLIQENFEPLLEIPSDIFARQTPHPYQNLGAPYNGRSPYYLRSGVLEALFVAHFELQNIRPGWKLKIFDAFRPVAVQQFMVDYTFKELSGLMRHAKEHEIWSKVYQFWASPSYDPKMPPPHSTGAAIDLTLMDECGKTLNLGAEIDEISERSHPNYYELSSDPVEKQYQHLRNLLNEVMKKGKFSQHPQEWWHFSLGDQMWAYQHNLEDSQSCYQACYGRVS